MEEQLINLERALAHQEKMLKDLNTVVIEQGHDINRLKLVVQNLLEGAQSSLVKPLSEETPPPHY